MMRTKNCKLQIVVLACGLALLFNPMAVAAPFSFDDIVLWFGSGANRAALVVDWYDGSLEPHALVWGYRWDGAATGANMLTAVVAGDPRLFAKVGGASGNPSSVFGLGYDANGDHEFGIDDGTTFDSAGFASSGPADLATANNPGDYYAEGWFTGFWHYGVASANPYDGGAWSDVGVGMAARTLTNGAWDSWTFTPTFNFAAYAQNPTAALPYPGDFNLDGQVDGLDYTVWRSAFGSSSQPAADANSNGTVDAADYVVWRKNLAAANGATSAHATPEPTTLLITIAAILIHFAVRRRTLIDAHPR